jgi:hypothetical protein
MTPTSRESRIAAEPVTHITETMLPVVSAGVEDAAFGETLTGAV